MLLNDGLLSQYHGILREDKVMANPLWGARAALPHRFGDAWRAKWRWYYLTWLCLHIFDLKIIFKRLGIDLHKNLGELTLLLQVLSILNWVPISSHLWDAYELL
jgi:hypothetical protein